MENFNLMFCKMVDCNKKQVKFYAYEIRKMQFDDLKYCIQIWREVKLQEAASTLVSFFRYDPDGFYVADLDGKL